MLVFHHAEEAFDIHDLSVQRLKGIKCSEPWRAGVASGHFSLRLLLFSKAALNLFVQYFVEILIDCKISIVI